MITREQYLDAIILIKKYKEQINEDICLIDNIIEDEDFKETYIYNICSVRLGNALTVLNDVYLKYDDYSKIKVSDLSKFSEIDFLKCRRFGKRSLDEVKDICKKAKIKLKQNYD